MAQLEKLLAQILQDRDPVDEYNFKFTRVIEELHQQRCLMDDDYSALFGEGYVEIFPLQGSSLVLQRESASRHYPKNG